MNLGRNRFLNRKDNLCFCNSARSHCKYTARYLRCCKRIVRRKMSIPFFVSSLQFNFLYSTSHHLDRIVFFIRSERGHATATTLCGIKEIPSSSTTTTSTNTNKASCRRRCQLCSVQCKDNSQHDQANAKPKTRFLNLDLTLSFPSLRNWIMVRFLCPSPPFNPTRDFLIREHIPCVVPKGT